MIKYTLGTIDLARLCDALGESIEGLPISGSAEVTFIDHEPGAIWPHRCEYRISFVRTDGLNEARRIWWTHPPHEQLEMRTVT